MFGAQLAAGRRDIDAARVAHRRRYAVLADHLGEALDSLRRGTLEGRGRGRIERNDVDVAEETLEQGRQFGRDLVAIVDALDQRILEGDAATGRAHIAATG